jgi:hypothetical protein
MRIAVPSLRIGLLFVASLVSACGGGGGGSEQPGTGTTPGTFNVQAVLSAFYQTPATYALTESLTAAQTGSSAVTLHAVDTFVPGVTPDPQVAAATSATMITTKVDPVTVDLGSTLPQSSTTTYYYAVEPFRLVARASNSALSYFTLGSELPTSASIGQSGLYGTLGDNTYGQAASVFWSVEAAETPGTAFVCLSITGRQISYEQCARVAANGAIIGERVYNNGPLLGVTVDLRSALP